MIFREMRNFPARAGLFASAHGRPDGVPGRMAGARGKIPRGCERRNRSTGVVGMGIGMKGELHCAGALQARSCFAGGTRTETARGELTTRIGNGPAAKAAFMLCVLRHG